MTKDIKEIEMKNISVHIKKGEKTTFTFKKPIATYGTRISCQGSHGVYVFMLKNFLKTDNLLKNLYLC